jgi:hypothetical protein
MADTIAPLCEFLMDVDKFAELQYTTLREEIRETKARIFYIAAIGLFVLPGGDYLTRTLETPSIRLVLPLLVVCVVLLYLSENHALMRCGRYIREQIEEKHIDHKATKFTGWESWLESQDAADRRSVDKFVSYAFYLLTTVYYLLSSVAAYNAGDSIAKAKGMPWLPGLLIALYSALGVSLLVLLVRNIRSTTGTKHGNIDKKT